MIPLQKLFFMLNLRVLRNKVLKIGLILPQNSVLQAKYQANSLPPRVFAVESKMSSCYQLVVCNP
jgi:hypothetical protein